MMYAHFRPEPSSGEWAKFTGWLENELQSVYKKLAAHDTTAEETQQLRGKAAFINKLLGLGKGPYTPPPQG